MKKYTLSPENSAVSFNIDYQKELNQQQLDAVMAPGGPMMVIAGAGSGKTRTVTYRVARLIETGVDPSRILLVTFTRKAAREMLHRVELLTGKDTTKIWGGTFHHIANLVLRKHGPMIGLDRNYTILDREDSKDLLADCVRELNIDTKARRFPTPSVLEDIEGLCTDTEKKALDIISERYPAFEELAPDVERVIKQYKSRKVRFHLVDYGDLLAYWRQLLAVRSDAREHYQKKFQHIMVDEYQDTNKIQAEIIDMLAQGHRNLMVVGDDAQSIYSFRGADFGNIIDFPKRYPDARCYKLEINYRSVPEILDLTNDSIANNVRQFHKTLVSVKKNGFMPSMVPLDDSMQQAAFVAQRILELRDEGMPLSDMAVLYRSHYHSMELQMELIRRGIPFIVRSGMRFFEQAHIKDIVSFLKILVNPFDELALKRILKLLPGIGSVTANKIWQRVSDNKISFLEAGTKELLDFVPRSAKKHFEGFVLTMKEIAGADLKQKPSEAVNAVLSRAYNDYLQSRYPDYKERREDIRQLENFARQYDSIDKFVSELALLGTVESEVVAQGPDEDESLVLSSVHQAKGLEWSAVFIIWLSEGRFPVARSLEEDDKIEEERRLFYVAATRAKEQLYLCYPVMAESYSGAYIMKPSRFLTELNPKHYEEWRIE